MPDVSTDPEPPEEEDPPVEEDPIDYAEVNAETVEQLNIALGELEDYYCIEEFEEKLVSISISCINKVLKYENECEITNDFVEDICSAEIKEARNVWKGVSASEKTWFYQTAIPMFNMTTVEFLSNFFGIDAPSV